MFRLPLSPPGHPYHRLMSRGRAQARAWHSEVFARSSVNDEKNIRRTFLKLLTGLWLKKTPSAYSFCNLDLHPVTAYSHLNRCSCCFRPPACIEVLECSELYRTSDTRLASQAQRVKRP